jgi:lipid II isoglutaminyl synthase (glutamine-hydrolysing)
MNFQFYLTHLYPKHMSIYGDMGNIIALKHRLEKIGMELVYQIVELADPFPARTDFYFMGGGQDKEQYLIFTDLINKSKKLVEDIEDDVPILAICGGYQLLGKYFITGEGLEIPGIGIFPIITTAPNSSIKSRCIGNIIMRSNIPEVNSIFVGFENHSGQTFFVDSTSIKATPLGKVLYGFGNNTTEKIEGCVYKNAVGTYMHGSCLPKNPELADYLIKKALQRKMARGELPAGFDLQCLDKNIDDTIAITAKKSIIYKYDSELAQSLYQS